MRKLASIAIVFGGILVFSTTPTLLVYLLQSMQYSGDFGLSGAIFAVLGIIPLAIAVFGGSYLIKNRHELATRWFDDEPVGAAPETLPLLRIGLILMGLWLAITSAAQMFTMIASALEQVEFASVMGTGLEVGSNWVLFARVAISGVMLVVGSILIKHSESIASRLWLGPEILAEDDI
jgi:hypothetical protein